MVKKRMPVRRKATGNPGQLHAAPPLCGLG